MIIKQPDDFMFQWMDKGVPTLVRAVEVNWWLNEFDNHITSKQFRTYHTNIIFIQQLLHKSPSTINKTKRTFIYIKSPGKYRFSKPFFSVICVKF